MTKNEYSETIQSYNKSKVEVLLRPSLSAVCLPAASDNHANHRDGRWTDQQAGRQVAGSSLIHTGWIADVAHS